MSTELPSPASLLDPAVWDSRRFDGAWRPADTVRPVVEPATGAV